MFLQNFPGNVPTDIHVSAFGGGMFVTPTHEHHPPANLGSVSALDKNDSKQNSD